MEIKVELLFVSSAGPGPFFTVGDPVLGVIGSDAVLGYETYVDISRQLLSFSITRGKSRELNAYEPGQLNLTFNNNNRFFDPNFAGSPYFGQIVPRRQIRLTLDGQLQFVGVVEDWSLTYDPAGISVAGCVAIDNFAYLAGQQISGFSASSELSGARVEAALDYVNWPEELRDIDTGRQTLQATAAIQDELSVLDYLSRIEISEPGSLFIDKSGNVKFVDRVGGFTDSNLIFSDSGDGVAYEEISVIYGSELLYNKVALANSASTAIAEDETSQTLYGLRELTQDTLISSGGLSDTATFLVAKYRDPEFRFENLSLNLYTLDEETKADILGLELGDIVDVRFTPSNIPPQVSRAVRIVNIEHEASAAEYRIRFGFESLQGSPLIVGSEVFGIIGTNTVGF